MVTCFCKSICLLLSGVSSASCNRSEEHTSELQSLSLHDALPILYQYDCQGTNSFLRSGKWLPAFVNPFACSCPASHPHRVTDRKSTRLNSSHFPYTTLFRSYINMIARGRTPFCGRGNGYLLL